MSKKASKSIIESVFLKAGGEGKCTKLFANLPQTQKSEMLEKILLKEKEEPTIAFACPGKDWFLITTHRLIWVASGVIKDLDFDQVSDATIDSELALKRKASNAADLCDLKVLVIDGEPLTLELEPGAAFSSVWNTLKFLSNKG